MSGDRVGTGRLTDDEVVADVESQIRYILSRGEAPLPVGLAFSTEIENALGALWYAVRNGGDVDTAVGAVREALDELLG